MLGESLIMFIIFICVRLKMTDRYPCIIIGLQQCVSAKNGSAISNPVLHRDCRSISGSTSSTGNQNDLNYIDLLNSER